MFDTSTGTLPAFTERLRDWICAVEEKSRLDDNRVRTKRVDFFSTSHEHVMSGADFALISTDTER